MFTVPPAVALLNYMYKMWYTLADFWPQNCPSLRSGQFRGQKSRGPLDISREMAHYVVCPQKKNNVPHFQNQRCINSYYHFIPELLPYLQPYLLYHRVAYLYYLVLSYVYIRNALLTAPYLLLQYIFLLSFAPPCWSYTLTLYMYL
jgi:hypothetical protein